MEELFKFAHYVEAITEAHANGSTEAERANGAKGLQWIEAVCVPDYDPATGEAIESRTFAELVRQHATTPGGEYAFIEAVERHAHAIMAEADKYLTTADENTPQGKYMKHCFDIAENIVWEAEEANERFSIQPVEANEYITPDVKPCEVKRGPLLYECDIDKQSKAKLFLELVKCGVFVSNEGTQKETFCAFVFGDNVTNNSSYLFVENKDKLTYTIKEIMAKANLNGIKVRRKAWETVRAWVRTSVGVKYNSTTSLRQAKNKYPEIAAAIKDAFNKKQK